MSRWARCPARPRRLLPPAAGGPALGELAELKLEDLDGFTSRGSGLRGRRLTVRKGKELSDRAVCFPDTVVAAVQAYLPVHGLGPTDHLFLYRNEPLCKDLVRDRVQAAGERAGVKVFPHRLRHTCATQLLKAGCRVTSIQKFLGHKRLNSTMVYARVHEQTVADDYYSAMERVEQRLDIALPATLTGEASNGKPLNDKERERLLAGQLADLGLSSEARMDLVERMRKLVNRNALPDEDELLRQENGKRPRAPAYLPPSGRQY